MRDVKGTLEDMFIPLGLVEMWPAVAMRYDYFKFTDQISDDKKYDEYVWVVEQYRKYIGKQKAAVLSMSEDLDKLAANIESWLADGSEKISVSKDESIRPRLVYVAMRNEWLMQLLYVVNSLKEEYDGYGIE